jgi:carboxypeptidase C (cathepsin A)
MLYLDQPVQVGLSYDTLQNITNNLLTGDITLLNATDPVPQQNSTFLVGTYPSQDVNTTAFGSLNGARALWHFAQTWFQEFPGYHPNDSRVSITTESYGGRYGPSYSAYFQEQNQKIANGTWNETGEVYTIHLDTLLIINGCIDRQVQWPSYPQIAFNNTYGIKTVNESTFNEMINGYYSAGGCRDQINTCRELSLRFDPTQRGLNASVNKVCEKAETYCTTHVRDLYTTRSGRNYYDFTTLDPDPFPDNFYLGYLNQAHIQQALGVPLNFTQSSSVVSAAFRSIGDYPRPGWLEDLTYLLENEIKVTLVYGDRDFACNWLGGEAVSLAVEYTNTTKFHAAGYAPLHTNSTHVGGQVRQYGNFSFTRVYESGHEVPAYQPETAYRIFTRSLFNKDISTGKIDTAKNSTYGTKGLQDTRAIKNIDPPDPKWVCYTLAPEDTCTEAQVEALLNGTAVVKDYILENANSTSMYPGIFS